MAEDLESDVCWTYMSILSLRSMLIYYSLPFAFGSEPDQFATKVTGER